MKPIVSLACCVFLSFLFNYSTCLGQELAGASVSKVPVLTDSTDKHEIIRELLFITRASDMAKQNSAELFSYDSNYFGYKISASQFGNKYKFFSLDDNWNSSESITLYKPVKVDIKQWKALGYKKQSFSYFELSQALLGELLYVIATNKYSYHNFNFAPNK